VTIAAGKELTPTNAFALAAWVKVDPTATGAIFQRGTSYALRIIKGRLALDFTVGGEARPLFGQRPVADGQWHYVVCCYDGFELALYVDGARDVRTHTGGAMTVSEGALVLGRFAGRLRDVAVYGRALSESEVILLHEVVSQETRGPLTVARGPKTPAFLYAAIGGRPGQPVLVKAEVAR
jgi:hypothetical protein